jgi:hypothetical protein
MRRSERLQTSLLATAVAIGGAGPGEPVSRRACPSRPRTSNFFYPQCAQDGKETLAELIDWIKTKSTQIGELMRRFREGGS